MHTTTGSLVGFVLTATFAGTGPAPWPVLDGPPARVAGPADPAVAGAVLAAAITAAPIAASRPLTGHDWPLRPQPEVVNGYAAPPQPWAAGHRGVDLATTAGATVRASGAGVVTFAGPVAGRTVITISHPDGRRTTYEPLAEALPQGSTVQRGDPIGTVAAAGSHCAPAACLHWGLVLGEQGGFRVYGDPLLLLGLLPRVILLPLGR